MREELHMKISELSKKAGVPASTIYFYSREGLLPPPVKPGKTIAYYSREHLERIALIKKLKGQGKTLNEIKKIVEERYGEADRARSVPDNLTTNRREAIIRSAIKLFRKKGFNGTSVIDIVSDAGAGKETFYAYFKNKEELFIECADRIFHEMYDDIFQQTKDEKSRSERLRKMLTIYFSYYPQWVDMMNIVRGASISKDPMFSQKLRQVMDEITEPIVRDLEIQKKEGTIPKGVESKVIAYIMMGLAEYCAYLQYNGDYPKDYILDYLTTVMKMQDLPITAFFAGNIPRKQGASR